MERYEPRRAPVTSMPRRANSTPAHRRPPTGFARSDQASPLLARYHLERAARNMRPGYP